MKLLRRGLEVLQHCIPDARTGTAVLAYHLVGAGTHAVVDVPLDEFRRQLDWLVSECEVVSLDAALVASPATNKKRVLLTFDDAFRNFRERAWPELSARRLPAVLYVPVAFVRGQAPSPLTGAPLPALSMPELMELSRDGLTIGSHSVSHRNLRRLSAAEVARELGESRQILEQELAVRVDSFCYPQAKLNRRISNLARQHYRTAVSAGGRPFRNGSLLSIPRFPVRQGEPHFARMVRSSLWMPESMAHQLRQFKA
ncbi:MAG: polysaccharide deacetylase family protein [Myxococcales bacterium]